MKKTGLPLVQIIKNEILEKGPMSFSTFMEKCLVHEQHGIFKIFENKFNFKNF
jgi:SAM-dependent MidA family methyltransferase